MTQEEKAKRYDEALERAKEKYAMFKGMKQGDVLEVIFPELKESEDEKIRKSIIAIINNYVDNSNTFKPEMIAWLEKQGKIVDYYEDKLDECACKYFNKGYKQALEKQGEQKPTEEYNITGISSNKSQGKLGEIIKNLKTVWSEGDENYHRICLDLCTGMPNGGAYAPYIKDEAINWLKSLKDRVQLQSQWKPSGEQMEFVWKYAEQNNYDGKVFARLYNDLKKLKGE